MDAIVQSQSWHTGAVLTFIHLKNNKL